jgi:SAM-dependent methyltransferase
VRVDIIISILIPCSLLQGASFSRGLIDYSTTLCYVSFQLPGFELSCSGGAIVKKNPYLMEHNGESERLEKKTDPNLVQEQARWAGLRPGMRVADIGCGPGKTSAALYEIVQPGGQVVGVDGSQQRVDYALGGYGQPGLDFVCRDISASLEDLGQFDFIWVRFFLEYHSSCAFQLVKKFASILRPGGILCLIDLDFNCINYYELPPTLEKTMYRIIAKAEQETDFDTRMGIKLYSFLYDLGFEEIDVAVSAHHLIFGPLKELDDYNWTQKVKIGARQSGYSFDNFDGGFDKFYEEFRRFFTDPRRFSYTPLIACRGCKPIA